MACELDLVLTCSRRRKQLKMISSSLMIPTCFLIISASLLVGSGDAATHQKLFFVFGDSYADTGNLPKSGLYVGTSWLYPYGITWPHYPDGRFCDGKFQTDFFGKKDYNPSPNLQPASFLPSLDIEFFPIVLSSVQKTQGLKSKLYNPFRRADHHHPCIVEAATARIF
jgi:hypothetical protein